MGGLILGRGVAGVGGGGLVSVNTIIVSDLVDLRHRGLFQVCAVHL
jgi:MFS family permease